MDNASTHMDSKVAELIRGTGAYLLYTAPYSPDLNPIKLAFNMYKSQLKRNKNRFNYDWFGAHISAIESVNRDICVKEFRRCGFPMSSDVLTTSEINKLSIALVHRYLV